MSPFKQKPRKVVQLVLALSLFVNSGRSFAASPEEVILKATAKEYVKSQLLDGLKNYLNQNPQAVGSLNPRLGTQTVKVISKALAVYALFTAKTDNQKAWASLHVVYSPEPVTALIIFALQLTDVLLQMQHGKIMAQMRLRTIQMYEELVKLNERQHNNEVKKISEAFSNYGSALAQIEREFKRIERSPTVLNIFSTDKNKQFPAEADIEKLILDLIRLQSDLENFDRLASRVLQYAQAGVIENHIQFAKEIKSVVAELRPAKKRLERLQTLFTEFERAVFASNMTSRIQDYSEKIGSQYFQKIHCFNLENQIESLTHFDPEDESVEGLKQLVLNDCNVDSSGKEN